MPVVAALPAIGGAISGASGLLGAASSIFGGNASNANNAAAAAAAQYNPFNVTGAAGSQTWNPETGTMDLGFSGDQQARNDMYQGMGQQFGQMAMGSMPGAQFAQNFGNQAIQDMPGAYAAANNFAGPQSSFFGQDAMQNAAGQGFGAAGNMAGMGNQAMQMAQQQGGSMFDQGQQMFGAQGPEWNPQYAQEAYDQGMALLQPQQEQATNKKMQQLMNSGNLGSTGGAMQAEGLANSQRQAEGMVRQQALGRADNRFSQDIQRQQYGQGMGLQAMMGGGALSQQGFGQGIGSQQGMFQALQNFGNLEGQGWQQGFAANQAGYGRANDRLQRAMGTFGFGNDLSQQFFGNMEGLGNQQHQLQTGLLGLGNMAASGGSTQQSAANTQAGILQGQTNPVANALGGMDFGAVGNAIGGLAGMFGGGAMGGQLPTGADPNTFVGPTRG